MPASRMYSTVLLSLLTKSVPSAGEDAVPVPDFLTVRQTVFDV